tara:strand:+ start:237 stop:998 length:762 start_codon:yes stop_codon:yes gene_type:complete
MNDDACVAMLQDHVSAIIDIEKQPSRADESMVLCELSRSARFRRVWLQIHMMFMVNPDLYVNYINGTSNDVIKRGSTPAVPKIGLELEHILDKFHQKTKRRYIARAQCNQDLLFNHYISNHDTKKQCNYDTPATLIRHTPTDHDMELCNLELIRHCSSVSLSDLFNDSDVFCDEQLSPNDQHIAANDQHTSPNDQHTSTNDQHTSTNDQHTSANDQHTSANDQHTSANDQPLEQRRFSFEDTLSPLDHASILN